MFHNTQSASEYRLSWSPLNPQKQPLSRIQPLSHPPLNLCWTANHPHTTPQYHGCPSLHLLGTQTMELSPHTQRTVRLHHIIQMQTQNPPVQTGILTLTGHCALHLSFLFLFLLCHCLFLIFCDVILWFYAFILCKVTLGDLKGAIKQMKCIIIRMHQQRPCKIILVRTCLTCGEVSPGMKKAKSPPCRR